LATRQTTKKVWIQYWVDFLEYWIVASGSACLGTAGFEIERCPGGMDDGLRRVEAIQKLGA